jgi:hypothetical protein
MLLKKQLGLIEYSLCNLPEFVDTYEKPNGRRHFLIRSLHNQVHLLRSGVEQQFLCPFFSRQHVHRSPLHLYSGYKTGQVCSVSPW